MENFPHLPFEPIRTGLAKLPSGGGGASPQTEFNKEHRAGHKQALGTSLDRVKDQYEFRFQLRSELGLPDILPGVPILLQVDPNGFDAEAFKSHFWGLEVVCEMEDGYVIVVSPDADLASFYIQLDRFASNVHGGGTVASVHGIVFEEDQSSRLRRILDPLLIEKWAEIDSFEAIDVEISIESLGTKKLPNRRERDHYDTEERFLAAQRKYERELNDYFEEHDRLCMERENSIRSLIEFYGGQVTDTFEEAPSEVAIFADCFTVIATISGIGLRDIALNYPFVFEIVAKESFSFENDLVSQSSALVATEVNAPDASSPTIVIIDSGIQEGHPLLSPAIRSDLSRNFLELSGTTHDDLTNFSGGHGTRVAGAALYPNGIPIGHYQLPFFLINAKVLDSTGKMPSKVLPARLLERIVTHYRNLDSSIKIYNHSIASITSSRQGYMSSWAAMIDELTYHFDVLFVQAAGNLPRDSSHSSFLGIKQHLIAGRQYPDYLRGAGSKVANPSQSFNSLTVGSISGEDHQSPDYHSIANINGPSPFSRTGPAIWNVLKPDVVEFGGNLMRSRDTRLLLVANWPQTSLELPRRSDQGVLFDRSEVGTSYSAPKIAYQAAMLQALLPQESSLLYRGLIAQSARWPVWTSGGDENFDRFAHFGLGLPNLERASRNSENRITFYSLGRKPILSREIHFFEVPIPDEIRRIGTEYDILIEVTLSYSAKPRRTRRNLRKYLSTWVEWISSKRDESMESFVNRAEIEGDQTQVQHSGEIPWMLRERDDWGQVNGIKRNVGTLQKDWATIKSHQLGESFSIAVRGRQGWDTTDKYPAYYSLIVSMEATNAEIELYSRIRNEVQVRSQIEIPIRVL